MSAPNRSIEAKERNVEEECGMVSCMKGKEENGSRAGEEHREREGDCVPSVPSGILGRGRLNQPSH